MNCLDVLIELLDRIAANQGTVILISEDELYQWPTEAVRAMKEQKLIAKARPATSAICPGCEDQCVMPVNILPGEKGSSSSFVICDKRNDINRILIVPERLAQWQGNLELLTEFVAASLGLRPGNRQQSGANLWEVGMATGNKRKQMLCLKADGVLSLVAGDSELPMAEAIGFEGGRFFLATEMIRHLVDFATTADNRYTPGNARREARKLDTQAMYQSWQKAYRKLKKTRPDRSDTWYSQQISKMDIAHGRNSETIRKNMKN